MALRDSMARSNETSSRIFLDAASRRRSSASPNVEPAAPAPVAWRPKQARSTPPIFWMTAARIRAIACGSTDANAGSEMSRASSAPIARACFNAILPSSPPTEMAVTVPPLASFSCRAASTAYSSHGLITRGASPHAGLPFSTLMVAVVSGVVLTQATSFKATS